MARSNFTPAPGAKGVKPKTGGTSGPYSPSTHCAAKRKSFNTGTGSY
jgi:hypothetical protein